MYNKIIYTDCDGVLLNWRDSFFEWMTKKGYEQNPEGLGDYGLTKLYSLTSTKMNQLVDEFNSSAAIGFLNPQDDSLKMVKELYERGYRFVVVTSLGTDIYSKKLRERNLHEFFGNAILEVICLHRKTSKKEALKTFVIPKEKEKIETLFIDDHINNVIEADQLGYLSILYNHVHNLNDNWSGMRVNNWSSIKSLVLDGYYKSDDGKYIIG